MANTLAALKFVDAVQPKSANAKSPVERRREAMIARLDEQVQLATALLEGKAPTFTRTVKDKTTGEKKQQSKNVRAWWWSSNGKMNLTVKYGLHVLKLSPKGAAIECASIKALVSTLQTVKTAVQAGELDTAIAAATAKREKKPNAK